MSDNLDAREMIIEYEGLLEEEQQLNKNLREEYEAYSNDRTEANHADWVTAMDELVEWTTNYGDRMLYIAAAAETLKTDRADGELIHEDNFEDYARDLAEDLGYVKPGADWPNSHIDWEAAATALKQDYTSVDIAGETYYYRA